jgi:hypothetical protein
MFACTAPKIFTFQNGSSVETCGHGWHGAGCCGHSQGKQWQQSHGQLQAAIKPLACGSTTCSAPTLLSAAALK